MKHTKLALLLSSVLLSSVAAAESNPLTCKVTLTQTQKRGWFLGGLNLMPRTTAAKKFVSFTLDPEEGDGQAWVHQNQCISKRDFKSGAFQGTLCIFLMTRPETRDAASPALDIWVGRDAVSLDREGDPLPQTTQSYGGVQAVVPLNGDGKSFLYSQRFATSGAKGELEALTISCGAS